MIKRSSASASGAGELVCQECGVTSKDGAGWRAEVAPDLLEGVDDDEVAVYCRQCWPREFSPDAPASGDA